MPTDISLIFTFSCFCLNCALLESQQNLLLIDYQRIKYNKECNC